MCLGKIRVHLHGVAELNHRLAVSLLVEVMLAALQVLLLLDVGIARASGPQQGQQETEQHRSEGRETTHDVSLQMITAGRMKDELRDAPSYCKGRDTIKLPGCRGILAS